MPYHAGLHHPGSLRWPCDRLLVPVDAVLSWSRMLGSGRASVKVRPMTSRARSSIILIAIAVMTGCGGPATPSPDQPTTASPLPAGEWGPLAVWDDPGTGDSDFALLAGTISIGDECVTVGGYVAVWPATFTRWVPDERSIEFLDPLSRAAVRIHDGDRVELGGGEATPDLTWIAQPDAACPASLFGVGTIGSVNDLAP